MKWNLKLFFRRYIYVLFYMLFVSFRSMLRFDSKTTNNNNKKKFSAILSLSLSLSVILLLQLLLLLLKNVINLFPLFVIFLIFNFFLLLLFCHYKYIESYYIEQKKILLYINNRMKWINEMKWWLRIESNLHLLSCCCCCWIFRLRL